MSKSGLKPWQMIGQCAGIHENLKGEYPISSSPGILSQIDQIWPSQLEARLQKGLRQRLGRTGGPCLRPQMRDLKIPQGPQTPQPLAVEQTCLPPLQATRG